jgi:hypothetical protein
VDTGPGDPSRLRYHLLGMAITALCASGCEHAREGKVDGRGAAQIVGAWIVEIPDAPFPLHMFVFHSDGTVEQSNPDAGDPRTSDSSLMGAWQAAGEGYKGKLVEITADRTTHRFASKGEITFVVKVGGDSFAGSATAAFFDATGRQVQGPINVTMTGERVIP